MIDVNIIKKMNSKNVASNTAISKNRINEIWDEMSKMQKEDAVKIGDFSNFRSFNKARGSGQISVRMVLALAIATEVNPFYITGDSEIKNHYNDSVLNDFVVLNNMESLLEYSVRGFDKIAAEKYVMDILAGLTDKKVEEINSLTNEDLSTLLSSVFIRQQIGEDEELRLFLIKLLLVSK